MWEHYHKDTYMQLLGMELVRGEAGESEVHMKVQQTMLNFHGSVNGGAIFSLADVAFAVASNSHGVPAVGVNMNISYMQPAYEGDHLIARATEEKRTSRLAWYRIEVYRETTDGEDLIALAQGIVYRKNNR